MRATSLPLILIASAAVLTGTAAPAAERHGHAADTPAVSIARAPADLPAPLARRAPARVRVDLETVEINGRLDDGTTYHYWTFNRKVPGPFVRVRVGDTVDVTLRNAPDSAEKHSVDFHAASGPAGGGAATDAAPGVTKGFSFKALNPGLYVYHCATPPTVAQHIANGMYGLILVEPADGLPVVDREFYVMQGELYTERPFGTKGEQVESLDKLINERPEYFLFNGAVGALTRENALKAETGKTIRLFFGVGGPNFTSSFHVIGEIFDKVYLLGSVTSRPIEDVQTLTVPPGGAVIADLKLDVPGTYVLVDHALSRVKKGLAGFLEVTGPEDAAIFREGLKTN